MDGEITPDEVREALEGDRPPRLVDIRAPSAFAQGHIPGSVNIPFGDLPDRIDALADAEHIVTICPHGKASVQAARLITSYEGTQDACVESMAGGLAEWPAEFETGDGTDAVQEPAEDGPAADAPF